MLGGEKCEVYWIYGGAKTRKRQTLLPFHKLNVTGRLQLTRFSHISRMSALFQPLHLHPRGALSNGLRLCNPTVVCPNGRRSLCIFLMMTRENALIPKTGDSSSKAAALRELIAGEKQPILMQAEFNTDSPRGASAQLD